MPIPVMNYASLPVSGDPLQAGLQDAIMRGYQMAYTPQNMQQELLKNVLANKLAQINNQYAPQMNEAALQNKLSEAALTGEQAKFFGPTAESEMALRRAQIPLLSAQAQKEQFFVKNPLLSQTGAAGQLGALQYMQANPGLFGSLSGAAGTPDQPQSSRMPGNFSDLMQQSIYADLKGQVSRANLAEKEASGYAYSRLPRDQKSYMVAQAGGMGILPDEANAKFASGYTIQDLAKEVGFDPKRLPDPIYPASEKDISNIHFRQQALAELNALDPILSDAMAPYSRLVSGYSPKQISESIKSGDEDTQARFLAARALQPEMASLRLKSMGGNVSAEAINTVMNASLGNMKAFKNLVSPEVYKKANEYSNAWINLGASRANAVGLNPQKQGNITQQNAQIPQKTALFNGKSYHLINGEWREG